MLPRPLSKTDDPFLAPEPPAGVRPDAPTGERAGRARGLVRSVRPHQWLKNLLVVAAPGAAGVLFHRAILARTALAFLAFCLASASMYLVNDVSDIRWDQVHPRRSRRPIASGVVPVPLALAAAVVLVVAAFGTAAILGGSFLLALGLYLGLTLAYSAWLKHLAVLDIAAVASGFVLRAVAGGVATNVHISQWFLILVSFASLFVVAGKRHGDLVALAQADPGQVSGGRRIEYTAAYLRYVWMVASGVAITAYCLWAFDQPHVRLHVPWSELSAVPFVLAVLRYALLLDVGKGAAPEEVALRDPPLLALAAAWAVVYGLGVYLGH